MIRREDYTYTLPDERIAKFPLPQRDHAKLQVYDKGKIVHTQFRNLCEYLPANSFLVFNNTKVIAARMQFQRDTGAQVEIFLLNPVSPSPLLSEAMRQTAECTWHCLIGNKKRLKTKEILTKTIQTKAGALQLQAHLDDLENTNVRFTWQPADWSFAQVVEEIGLMPLPPYLKRAAETDDRIRYQTVYAEKEGAVAAPTAGLHFTEYVFDELKKHDIRHDHVTLHVSAGTFRPLQADNVLEHEMHAEQIIFSQQNLENLLAQENIVAVGTTSMRALESLYWYGVKILKHQDHSFLIDQQLAYSFPPNENFPTAKESFQAVLEFMRAQNLEQINGQTQIYIVPGYQFRVCKGIITNYHQPESTLILLIAAFIGEDWRTVYAEAMQNDYRFLSFGDSSLLLP
jgi:S-adenosylmethionine:tRNA ribosyltransferase-isomerase